MAMKRWPRPFRAGRSPVLAPPADSEVEDGAVPQLRPRRPDGAVHPPSAGRPRLLQPLPLTGLVLVLLALAGYWAVLNQTTSRTPVVAATRSLPAGATLTARDLRVVRLAGDSGVLAGFVPAEQLEGIVGRRLGRAVAAGEPLSRAALARPGREPAAFTLAVSGLHALAGEIRPGDRVTVLVTYGSGEGQAEARAVARGLSVLAVGAPPRGLEQASATIAVTVALSDPSLATALALANSDGKIDLLREGGARSSAPIPPARAGQSG